MYVNISAGQYSLRPADKPNTHLSIGEGGYKCIWSIVSIKNPKQDWEKGFIT